MIRTSAGSPRFTLDTNILIYSVDTGDAGRQGVAIEIVDKAIEANCVLTLQSLSEFYSVATRKRIMAADRAANLVIQWLSLFPAVPASATAIRAALGYVAAGRASYWDALLVATAEEAGCDLALTEDMADGSVLGGVQIHNPFARSGGMTQRTQTLLGL
jgi:predicted nucleic acid-binding protein